MPFGETGRENHVVGDYQISSLTVQSYVSPTLQTHLGAWLSPRLHLQPQFAATCLDYQFATENSLIHINIDISLYVRRRLSGPSSSTKDRLEATTHTRTTLSSAKKLREEVAETTTVHIEVETLEWISAEALATV